MNKDYLNYEINKLIEEAFRKGYSHGFQHSRAFSDEEFLEVSKEVNFWRNDLNDIRCPPGSPMRNVLMPWCDVKSLPHKEKMIVKEFWDKWEAEQFEKIKKSRKEKEGFDSEGNRL